jgi:PhoH-like ATPase
LNYKDIVEVDNFDVGALYHDREIPLTDLATEGDGWLMLPSLAPNTPVILKGFNAQGKPAAALGIVKKDRVVLVTDKYHPYGIKAKDVAQTFALHMLADQDNDLVFITGAAGSGKTLLALAHAMQMARSFDVHRIVLTKPLVPIGREIGYLKGDYLDKVRPWLGNFYDNMHVLGITEMTVDSMVSGSIDALKTGKTQIEIAPITFMQGRSIQNAIMIIDEAQNLSKEVIKQILTRPAENTRVIMLGDPDQIFEKGLDEENNGFIWAIEKGVQEDFVAHIHLRKVQRSRISTWAAGLK